MLAHELRNPLAALSGAAAIAARSTDPDDVEWSRNAIQRNIKQLARLIDDLLDVSRVTQGKIELRKEHVEASSAIDQAVDSIQYLLAPKGHQIAVSLERGSLWVEADPARLQQIVTNLLTNAIQYSEEGGYIRLCAQRQDGEIVISVRDSGQGIRPELASARLRALQARRPVAGPYRRGLGHRADHGQGARRDARRHRVPRRARGPAKGANSSCICPTRQERPARPARPVSTPGPRRNGNRILVVDDNVDLSRALTTLLARFGYEVQAVNDGHTAIEAARRFATRGCASRSRSAGHGRI